MLVQKLAIFVAFSLGVCFAQTAVVKTPGPNKALEPESIGVFYYFDSTNQALKRLPNEEYKKRVNTVIVSGTYSSFRVTDNRPSFIFKVFKDEDAGKIKLYQFIVKKGDREYEVGKWHGGYAPNNGISCNVTKTGESSYKLTPENALAPGEYTLATIDHLYTFAVSDSGR